MSGKGRQKTPARVQIFYFEKKRDPSRATTATEIPADDGGLTLPHDFGDEGPLEESGGEEKTVRLEDLPLGTLAEAPPDLVERAAPPEPERGSFLADPAPRPSRRTRGVTGSSLRASTSEMPDGRLAALLASEHRPRLVPKPAELPPMRGTRGPASPAWEAFGEASIRPLQRDVAAEYHRRQLRAITGRSRSSAEVVDLARLGHKLFEGGRLREAQMVYQSLVAREPREAFVYSMLGLLYLLQSDAGSALALFDAALGVNPRDLAALAGRGEIRLRRGQTRLAVRDLERAIACDASGKLPFGKRARELLAVARRSL